MWIIYTETTGNLGNPCKIYKKGEYRDMKELWDREIAPQHDFSWMISCSDFCITRTGVRYWLQPYNHILEEEKEITDVQNL